MSPQLAATVAGTPVSVAEVDAAEGRLRNRPGAAALPATGTSEGRQLRRWLTQLIVTQRVIDVEAAARGLTARGAPTEDDLLPDATARLEMGSIAAVIDDDVADYHVRNPLRFAAARRGRQGWHTPSLTGPPLDEVRSAIADHLRGAARRRAFRVWLDARRATLVQLAAGYEHPGDPRQPDNTHRH